MVPPKTFREMALGFGGATEQPHFEKLSFRVNKKIFATLDEKNSRASFKLTDIEQSVFCAIPNRLFFPANGAWGKQGWTIADLKKTPKRILAEALEKSYLNVLGNRT